MVPKSCLGPGNCPQAQRRGEQEHVSCGTSCPTLSSHSALQAAFGRPGRGRCVSGCECVSREGDIPFIKEKRSYAQGSVKTRLEAQISLF